MFPVFHHQNDIPEFQEVDLLLGLEGMTHEEWNDAFDKMFPVAHPPCHAITVIHPYDATSEMPLQGMQDLHIALVLNNGELWQDLMAGGHAFMPGNPDMETALAVHESHNPLRLELHWLAPERLVSEGSARLPCGVQAAFPADCPRVRRIVTAMNIMASTGRLYEEFPAYSSVLLRLRVRN